MVLLRNTRRSTSRNTTAIGRLWAPIGISDGGGLQADLRVGRAKAGVDGNWVVQRRPFNGGIPFAKLAYIKPFTSADHTRQRNLSLPQKPTNKMTIRPIQQKRRRDLKVKSWVFGLFTRLDSAANRRAPIVAVEARLSVKNPPRSTAAAVPRVRSCFGNMGGGVSLGRLSNSWRKRKWSQLCEAKAKGSR
ncbi:hypothetical protein EV1_017478 [Malus domestica]